MVDDEADDHAREQRIKVNEPERGRLIVRRKDEILEHVADDPAQPVHGGGDGEVQRERIHVAAVGRQLAGGDPLILRAEALQEIGGKLLRAVGRIALAQPPVGEGHAHEVGDHEPRRRVGQPHGNAVRQAIVVLPRHAHGKGLTGAESKAEPGEEPRRGGQVGPGDLGVELRNPVAHGRLKAVEQPEQQIDPQSALDERHAAALGVRAEAPEADDPEPETEQMERDHPEIADLERHPALGRGIAYPPQVDQRKPERPGDDPRRNKVLLQKRHFGAQPDAQEQKKRHPHDRHQIRKKRAFHAAPGELRGASRHGEARPGFEALRPPGGDEGKAGDAGRQWPEHGKEHPAQALLVQKALVDKQA